MVGILCAGLFSGCSSPRLRGQVVQGPRSRVDVVDPDDPRLDAPPLAGATVKAMLDPDTPHPIEGAADVSDPVGRFSLPMDAFGVGVLEYHARVSARLEDHSPAVGVVPVPGPDKRVLIQLAPGHDRQPASTVDVLKETIRLGEPYLD